MDPGNDVVGEGPVGVDLRLGTAYADVALVDAQRGGTRRLRVLHHVPLRGVVEFLKTPIENLFIRIKSRKKNTISPSFFYFYFQNKAIRERVISCHLILNFKKCLHDGRHKSLWVW